MYQIQGSDLLLVLQRIIQISIKLEIYKNNTYVNEIVGGLISGNSSIDANSDIRRTVSLTFLPNEKSRLVIEEEGFFWIDKNVKISLGITNVRTGEIVWYKQGTYVFTNASFTYDAVTNQLELSCSDYVSLLDGTKNGQLGQQTILIPAYKEDETTGEVIHYYTIRESLIYTVAQLGRIKDTKIDDIGEYLGMPQYNDNYQQYRDESRVPVKGGDLEPIWNTVPYDLEFSSGTNVLAIIKELVNLYPNYEFYMDIDNNFCCNMIPSADEDDAVLDETFMNKILISESTTVDLTQVKNVTEIWGQTIDTDYSNLQSVSFSGNTYSASISGYTDKYYNGDKIALRVPRTNPADAKININGFGAIDIYDENTDNPLAANILEANEIYVFKVKSKYLSAERKSVMRAYFLGRYQVHALAALVDKESGELDDMYTTTSGTTVPRYSKEFFQDVYACEYVTLDVIPDSPFTCQKLGTILDVKSGEQFDNIESSSLALANARYELWKSARLTDSISLTTKLCPFMDVNQKIEYTPKEYDKKEKHQYIVKSLSHDWTAGTTTWELMRFYPLYRQGTVPLSSL